MTLLVLGINHKTASVAVREKVAFSEEKRQLALQQIHQQDLAESAVILSTCNRTEIYLHHRQISPQECKQWQTNCINWFANIHQLSVDELNKSIYTHQNQQAANHLMRVACGLDSLILGEPQILGQVKQAFQISEDYYQSANIPLSSTLSRLFQKTFATAKRVRTETNIGESAVSVAYAACSLARQIFESLRELQILLVGAGETIELVSRHLLRHGVKKLMIANRTLSRAEQLVEKLASNTPIDVYSLDELRDEIMPINKKYNIKMLMDSVHRYLEVSNANHGKVTIEYVLLDHVNDGTEHAHQLAQVLKNTPCKINLIPWNPFPEAPYGKSSNSRVDRFQKTLMEYGFTVIVRKTRGDDIDAACGQLAGDVIDRTKRTAMKRKFGEGIDVKAVN